MIRGGLSQLTLLRHNIMNDTSVTTTMKDKRISAERGSTQSQ
jgi:hypothetical protein